MTATPKHPDNRENGANTLQKYNFFLNVPNKMKQKKCRRPSRSVASVVYETICVA